MTRHMVGNDVDDHLHSLFVGTSNQRFKLLHAAGYIYRKIWVDLIVIPHRIGGACSPLDHIWVV